MDVLYSMWNLSNELCMAEIIFDSCDDLDFIVSRFHDLITGNFNVRIGAVSWSDNRYNEDSVDYYT